MDTVYSGCTRIDDLLKKIERSKQAVVISLLRDEKITLSHGMVANLPTI